VAKLIYQDPDSGQEVSVDIGPDAPEVSIGRNPGNTIRVNNPSISRKHAKIVYDAGRITLYDLNSSNGSYVNGNRVQNQALEDGDRIRTGEFPLDFVETAEVDFGVSSAASLVPAYDSGGFGQHAFDHEISEPGPTGAGDDFYQDDFAHDGGQAFAGGQAFGDGYDDNFGEPLMLEDSDFEEVLSDAAAAPQTGDPAQGIYPYEEEESEASDDEDLHYFADDGDFYEEDEQDVEPLPAYAPVDPVDHDDTLNAPLDEMVRGMAESRAPQASAEPAPAAAAAPVSSVLLMELEELRTQVERFEAERAQLIDEINANAQNPQGGAQRQLDRLRSERNRLSEERRTLIGQLKEARAELDERPEIAEIEAAQQTIEASNNEINELEAALSSARQDIGTRDSAIEALQSQVEELQGEFDEIQQRYTDVAQQKSAAANHGAQLNDELAQTQASLSELQSRYELSEATIESLETDLAELNNQRDALREEVDARTKLVADQEAQIADLKQHAQNQNTEIEGFGEREEALNATISRLEEQVDNLKTTLEARPTDASVAALREELSAALQELSSTTEERDALLGERAQLQQDLSETRELFSDIQDRLEVVSAERDEARRERDAHKLEKQAFARETDYLQTNRRKWVEQIEELEGKVAEYEADNRKKKKIFAELSSDLRALVQSNETLKGELSEAREQLEAGPSADEIQRRAARVAELEEQLQATQDEIAELNADSSELTRQLGEIAQQRDDLAEELEQAQVAHQEELVELTEQLSQAAGDDEALAVIQAERDALFEQVEALEAQLAQALEDGGEDGDADEKLLARVAELEAELSDREATLAELILARDELEDRLKSQAS